MKTVILENEVEIINEIPFIGRTFNGIIVEPKSVLLSIDDKCYKLIPNSIFGKRVNIRFTVPKFHKLEEFIGSKIKSIKQNIDLRSMVYLEVETNLSIIRIYMDCKDGHNGVHVKQM